MSTEIGIIKGTIHKHINNFDVKHIESELYVTRFYNGVIKGACIQLTVDVGVGYIHLTKEQTEELINLLQKSFDF